MDTNVSTMQAEPILARLRFGKSVNLPCGYAVVIRSTQQHHGFMRVSLTGPCNYTHTTLCGYCRPLTAYINRDQTLSFPYLTASFHFETNAKPSLRSCAY